ncbi:MAG: hypothetical protein A2V65_06895 [Deltaproteobacteria bacterium RBG_13_49_15]|nr:MAG: hypothetical protein A2V65_06895 [Deltaproteobacteria bacterium RBG_13_49_15]
MHAESKKEKPGKLRKFTKRQVAIVNNATAMAEEIVSNFFKISTNEWLRRRYDVRTLAELSPEEVVLGPFAQIIRYQGHRTNVPLGSSSYDFYKIGLQDHNILSVLKNSPEIDLFPFALYIVTHELIHIIRFSQFLQNFEASPDEKMGEERRVHEKTHDILKQIRIPGLEAVFDFYRHWRKPFDQFENQLENG